LKFSSPQDSHPHIHTQPASRVGRAGELRTCGITGAQCDARVRTLDQFHVVKQRPGRTSGTGVHARTHATGRGHYLAAETLWGWFLPGLRRISAGLGSLRCSSGLRLSSKEPYRRLPTTLGTRIAIIKCDPMPATRNRRAAEHDAI
jgi:hypothetical protein